MEPTFSIQTMFYLKGVKFPYGKFTLGNDRSSAFEIFALLKGNRTPVNSCSIHMELCQLIEGLPVPIGALDCNLDQLKENIAIISKEIFRMAQLEENTIVPLE